MPRGALDRGETFLAHLTSRFRGRTIVSKRRILDGAPGFVNDYFGVLGSFPTICRACRIFTTITHDMHRFSVSFPRTGARNHLVRWPLLLNMVICIEYGPHQGHLYTRPSHGGPPPPSPRAA